MSSVWVFFYGGLINPDVMKRVGMEPSAQEMATLPGYEIRISPLFNLVPNTDQVAYGLLFKVTHAELDHVYSQLATTYHPYPVLTHDLEGRTRPALCYIVPDMPPGQAEADHVQSLLGPAEQLGFPDWYLSRIRSFLPGASS